MHFGKSPGLRSDGALSLGTYLRTMRDAPKGLRTRFASRLFSGLFRAAVSLTPETCEFDFFDEYETKYRLLARLLDRPGKSPRPEELAFLRSIEGYAGRAGTIHFGDCMFLTACVSVVGPSRAIELGTLGGFSAAVIAAAIRWQHPARKQILVDTIDWNTHSLLEPEKPVGFLIRDMFPDFIEAVRVHAPAESGMIRELARRDELDFAFMDADHQHPRPLLDLVRLAPFMRPGGWVVLHDIRLGTETAAKRNRESLAFGAPFGAEWLFENWPFRKISGGNIGAVQIPVDKTAIVAPALRLMDLPFEVNPDSEARRVRRALHQSLVELL
jgi:predicted O-methyltransferase YrrM